MHAVALKLPEFWQEHAAVWFAQAEAQFALRGITQEDTKYYYVVAALNSSTASREQTAGECGDIRNARGSPSSTGTSKLSSALSSADVFQRLLVDFPDLTTPTFSSAAVKHGVDHFIATTGPPVHARARRLDPQKLAVAKAEFDSMERLGIVHDILVASVTSDEHQAHLRALFARLSEHGLIINLAKCQFGVPVVDFLGHRVTQEGAVPLPSKVEAIQKFPRPVTVRALQEFLGMVNFYHRFIPRAARLMLPLYAALKGAGEVN
ncbi:hypothetical protein AAFF_G00306820 [Aldrovandia affinis]|uniref:ribonuclease H n=1 Tax=Aldrovandia affinis TaxID=143900 RepID=A0AAD7W065_9TELE|nr:hypothetical protein AAFF_G00306820 [Aldrovandia affinis]